VLQALLEHPQEVVTREQLRQRFWPENTFVDHEVALKKAVNRLRVVLGDSAENPRYIETIPLQGYRIIGTLQAGEKPAVVATPPPIPPVKKKRWGLLVGVTVAALSVLLLALNVGKLRTRIFPHSGSPVIHSLAVLPLQNLSNDPDQDYFSDGMTDALTTELAQIRALRVISRASAAHFSGSRQTLPDVGRNLGADAIVEGSVSRSENRVRITAQLIDARTDLHL
jgi:TolB-like protein